MSKRPLTAASPAEPGDRVRLSVEFERTQLLGILFGEFDRNLVAIENRLGVYISARGNRVQIEGEAEAAARARDVLTEIYTRIERGEEIDSGLVDAVIAMTAQPTLDGIIRHETSDAPPVMIRTRKKTIVPRAPSQIPYMQALARDDVIFALGPAGTGKTYLAVAQAVAQLITGSVQRLILSRPAVEAGEKLHDCLPAEQVERRIASGEIEIAPLAFMRGRTLADAFIILDEAQNTTIPQMKMFLTRFGMNSRMVICGDPKQVDLPLPATSGLADAVARLEGLEGINVSRFTSADVVRHPIVGRIVEAYEGPGS